MHSELMRENEGKMMTKDEKMGQNIIFPTKWQTCPRSESECKTVANPCKPRQDT